MSINNHHHTHACINIIIIKIHKYIELNWWSNRLLVRFACFTLHAKFGCLCMFKKMMQKSNFEFSSCLCVWMCLRIFGCRKRERERMMIIEMCLQNNFGNFSNFAGKHENIFGRCNSFILCFVLFEVDKIKRKGQFEVLFGQIERKQHWLCFLQLALSHWLMQLSVLNNYVFVVVAAFVF